MTNPVEKLLVESASERRAEPAHFESLPLAALLLGFNTLMAMVFAGTVRYRAPWDFVLALLAAFALERAWELLRKRRSSPAASAPP